MSSPVFSNTNHLPLLYVPSTMAKKLIHRSMTVLAATMTVGVAGCAATYQEPSSGPRASIVFIDETTEKMGVLFHAGVEQCTERSGAGFVQPKSSRSVVIAAGKPVVFTVSVDSVAQKVALVAGGVVGAIASDIAASEESCKTTLEFVPEEGRTYEFRIRSEGGGCRHDLRARASTTSPPGETPATSYTTREWVRAFGEAGPWCKKAAGANQRG